jgi:catechol 2,3-dioxygenase-like lactoylglutathione lyase family enzyme
VFDHLGLKVTSLEASVRFYTAALAPLGHVLASRDETSAGIGPKGEPALWLYAAQAASERAAKTTAHRASGQTILRRTKPLFSWTPMGTTSRLYSRGDANWWVRRVRLVTVCEGVVGCFIVLSQWSEQNPLGE